MYCCQHCLYFDYYFGSEPCESFSFKINEKYFATTQFWTDGSVTTFIWDINGETIYSFDGIIPKEECTIYIAFS